MLSRRCSSHFQMFPLGNCLAFQAWKQPHLKRAFEPFGALNGWMEDAMQRSPKCPISRKKVLVSGQV